MTIQIGRAGNHIGNALWDSVLEEHSIEKTSCTVKRGKKQAPMIGKTAVYFDEDRSGKYWPRVLCCDLDLDDMLKTLAVNGSVPSYYQNRNILGTSGGSGNCYARAFHTEGLGVAQQVMSRFRKDIERCDSLQGVQFLHALGGGTGSGLCGLLMQSIQDYLDAGTKCMLYSACVAPSPACSNIVLETYNTALVLHDMAEYCHLVFPFDNSSRFKGYKHIGRAMSDLTSSQRFPGLLNGDIRKLHANTVPFRNTHFLTSSFASSGSGESVLELTQNVLSPEAVSFSVKQQVAGSVDASRYLACFLAFRGKSVTASEVDGAFSTMLRSGSHFDPYLPDWIPNCLSASICPEEVNNSARVTCFANNTSIHQFFDRITTNFDAMFRARSHVYLYEESGVHAQEMQEAMNLVKSISDQYKELALFEDKILFTDKLGKKSVNPNAVTARHQSEIAAELLSLAAS